MDKSFPILDNDLLDIFMETNIGTDEGFPVITEEDVTSFSSSTATELVLTGVNELLDTGDLNLPTAINADLIPLQTISCKTISSPSIDTDSSSNNSSPQCCKENHENCIASSESKPINETRKSSVPIPETTTPVTKNPSLLPPCRVCGEKASGFHYGANTCEPCKGFFRRCIVKIERNQGEYKCSYQGRCSISPGQRNVCSSCRYKKCVAAGMSKNAIKTGRYTYEKRTRDTNEVRKLQGLEKLTAMGQKASENEMKSIISRLVITQRKIHPDFPKIFDKKHVNENQEKAYNEYIVKEETFSSIPILTTEMYDEIYQETGIDLDGRNNIKARIAESSERYLRNMIDFMKSLPGASNIAVEDQSKLIKGSNAEFWFLMTHKLFNPDLNVIAVTDFWIHKDEVQSLFKNKERVNELFAMARSFLTLDLSEEEVALVRGITMTFTDRNELDNPEAVEQIQMKLLDCLQWLSKRNKLNPEQRFAKIVDKLVSLRDISELCKEANKEKAKWPVMQKYPLVLEILSG